jgi:S-adenosylhomocysteine hydrolase
VRGSTASTRSTSKPGQYEKQVYTLRKHLDEKVASLHLAMIVGEGR